jgi:predicted 2-oxoglutarate/Fe(II)-dependent dioxygenase YbiX
MRKIHFYERYMIPIYKIPEVESNSLTYEECEYIKQSALPKLSDAGLSLDKFIDKTIRNADECTLDVDDPKISEIMNRCTEHPKRCEGLRVVRYKRGGLYKPHQDAHETYKNNRVHTFIFALNDDYEGGETIFPNIKKSFKLKMGDALSFDTLDSWGGITDDALHGGEPVTSGEKWIAIIWERQFDI